MTEVGVKNCGCACWAKIPKSIVSTRCILRTIERTHGNSEGILEKVNAESEESAESTRNTRRAPARAHVLLWYI